MEAEPPPLLAHRWRRDDALDQSSAALYVPLLDDPATGHARGLLVFSTYGYYDCDAVLFVAADAVTDTVYALHTIVRQSRRDLSWLDFDAVGGARSLHRGCPATHGVLARVREFLRLLFGDGCNLCTRRRPRALRARIRRAEDAANNHNASCFYYMGDDDSDDDDNNDDNNNGNNSSIAGGNVNVNARDTGGLLLAAALRAAPGVADVVAHELDSVLGFAWRAMQALPVALPAPVACAPALAAACLAQPWYAALSALM
jgi:hypothetical protein